MPDGALYEKAAFACGCFWGKQYHFDRLPGVVSSLTGYTGGHLPNPTYQQVCTKTTGHAEAVEVVFNPRQLSFEALCRFFFQLHDPGRDRRGKGGQYRSAIFCYSTAQLHTARQLIGLLQAGGQAIFTELSPADVFWPAEPRHQKYCERHNRAPANGPTAYHCGDAKA